MIGNDNWIKLTVDRVTEAYELLSKTPRISLRQNGDQSLYLKMADDQIPLVNALLVRHGFSVMELSSQRVSLEEAFLRLTENAAPKSTMT